MAPDFDPNNDHALPPVNNVLRDCLGDLAIQIMIAKNKNFPDMNSRDMLRELHEIIEDLHATYHSMNLNFE